MFDKFGEFDSAEEINRAAAVLKADGDMAGLEMLAKENGLDQEDVNDFIAGENEELTTPWMACIGKNDIENREYQIKGILEDWSKQLISMCMGNKELQMAVRKKGKSLAECMALLIKFAFENKMQVSEKIVKITKVTHNGNVESMRSPLYMGIPNRVQVEKIIKEYYLG